MEMKNPAPMGRKRWLTVAGILMILGVITTIFIPLTFLAGIYGMNFVNMPELEWHWGYFATITVMIIIGVSMFAWFRNKGCFK